MRAPYGNITARGSTGTDYQYFSYLDGGAFGGGWGVNYYTNGGNDVVYGTIWDDTIHLAGGNETINTRGGNDTITGDLGGTDRLTGGGGFDFYNLFVGDDDFAVTITDFAPAGWTGSDSGPRYTESQARLRGDVLKLNFTVDSGIKTDAQADASIDFDIVGSDVVLTVDTREVHGTIRLLGVGDQYDVGQTYHFTVWTDALYM